MRKYIAFILFLLLFMTACSKDQVNPHDHFDSYINHWHDYAFEEMYAMLTKDASETYSTEDFVDRYEKIYEDLSINDLEISYDKLSDEALSLALEEGKATISIHAKMTSIAGEIEFDYDATLLRNDEDEQWLIDWDPGYIFPEIKDNGKISIETTEPVRGEILDRNKMPLAMNDSVYEIGVVPENMGDNEENIKKQLSDLLGMSEESIDTALNANWVEPHLFVPLKKVAKTKEDLLSKLWEIDSVMGNEISGRTYPFGEVTAHLVGYIRPVTAEDIESKGSDKYGPNDWIGRRGLEQVYEDDLRGEKGIKILIKKENEDDIVLAEQDVKNGENITVTIDINVQEEIFKAYGKEAGSATAIDPKTGEALALVSSPSFDPNDLMFGISQSDLKKLEDDSQMPLLNRFAATYAPGSVMKPISAIIGLQDGTINPEEGLEIKGLTWSNGKGWGDYKVRRVSQTNKPVDLADALIRSDNIYFAMQAIKMGNEAFIEGLKQLGFENDLPFAYPITNSTISSDGKLDSEVALANTSYGQAELEMSTTHLAYTYTPLLNDGNLIKPTLLTSEKTSEVWEKDIISAEQAKILQKALREVVSKGTAKKSADRDELEISGKTGTAELKRSSDEKGHENGWFVGYPTENPDILIAMMVEHAENIGTSSFVADKVANLLIKLTD